MPPEGATAEIDQAKLEQAIDGLQAASKRLDESRTKMESMNSRVDELLKKQQAIESGQGTDRESLAAIKKELGELAEKMENAANQHTEFVHITRGFMKQVAVNSDGGSERGERGAWMYRGPNSHGAMFESRQQALEIGAFLVATMKRDNEGKRQAVKWLQDHRSELRYLPQIPKSLVEGIGREWMENFQKLENGKAWLQDLGGSAVPGSVLVHPRFAEALIRNVEEHGKFRQGALIWPMGTDTVHIPKRIGGISVFWEGEAEAGSETDPNFTLLTMTAKKMMMLHQYSSELNEDAFLSIADIFMFEAALAISQEEDRIGFNGNGSGGNSPGFAGFVGVLGANASATEATAIANNVPRLVTGASGADLTTEITPAKLRAMTGLLPTYARRNAKWYMHRTVLADLDGIEYTNAGPVVRYKEGRSTSIMGYPVVEVDQMPVSPASQNTKVLALGDLRKGWILGDRKKPEVETSEHFAFNTDQLTVRVKARIGILRAQADSMVVYQTGTT